MKLTFRHAEKDLAVVLQLSPFDKTRMFRALFIEIPTGISIFLDEAMGEHSSITVFTSKSDVLKSNRDAVNKVTFYLTDGGDHYAGTDYSNDYSDTGRYIAMCAKGAQKVFKLFPGQKKFTLHYIVNT